MAIHHCRHCGAIIPYDNSNCCPNCARKREAEKQWRESNSRVQPNAAGASVRYKWLVRDNFSMYSGLGAGISLGFPIPVPYVAPIGIKFGKGKIYGIVEANVSAATTFGMAGIGIRL